MRIIRIMVTGGGSSGHISPALAIIKTLNDMAQGTDWRPLFRYVGGHQGIEERLVTAAGIDFVGIATGKLRRYFDLQNALDAMRVPLGVVQAMVVVRAFRPDILLSTGGYVGVPPVIAAWTQRVPILTHEQTVQIGLANRITSRFATRIALSFASAADELAPALRTKTVVTGNPVRPIIFDGNAAEAMRLAGFAPEDSQLPTLYVTGGSQGSRLINRAVEAALPELLQSCRVIHQCGEQPAGEEQDYERLQKAHTSLSEALKRRYFVTRFVNQEIGNVFALADLVLGRAGAGTLAELCVLGLPAVYVPLVPTGGDEQTRNARMCVAAGAAEVIPQAELSAERLLAVVRPLLTDRPRLQAMGQAALTLGKPDAAHDVAQILLAIADKR